MKAEELRVGNYIITEYSKNDIVASVDSCVCYTETSSRMECDYKDIKPIPLTEQWLKDFGFTFNIDYINSWDYDGDAYFGITDIEDKSFQFTCGEYIHGVPLKYVHELQNLFSIMTGKELI